MSLKIRLKRIGKKNRPYYKVVVVNSSSSVSSGKYLDDLGSYDPIHAQELIDFDAEKAKAWLAKGALPSERIAKLFKKAIVAV